MDQYKQTDATEDELLQSENESSHDNSSHDESCHLPDIDERYWRKAILQRSYYRKDVAFDRYRWALRYGQHARHRHGAGVEFTTIAPELEEAWHKFGGPSGLTWQEARNAIKDSWEYTDTLSAEAIAGHAGFKKPPTFSEQGTHVPRNLDEPNT